MECQATVTRTIATGLFTARGALSCTSVRSTRRAISTTLKSVRACSCGRSPCSFTGYVGFAKQALLRADDGSSASDATLGDYSGTSVPGDVHSTGSNMRVRFHTDSSVTRGGFSASYSCTTPPPPPPLPPPPPPATAVRPKSATGHRHCGLSPLLSRYSSTKLCDLHADTVTSRVFVWPPDFCKWPDCVREYCSRS